jgi:predicted NAD-dependent protein-ADP-ribosyltransferase YbiA (DUF1768 family)
MNLQMPPRTFWSTASFGDAADTSPMEMTELGQHMQQCSQPRSHWLLLRSGVDSVHQGLVARFVTSLALMVALVGTAVMVW